VRLSNPDRVLYEEAGITKRDLASYYEKVADWMLPHVAERVLTVVRCPEGHDRECFYQKHHGAGMGEDIHRVPLRDESGLRDYTKVSSLRGVVGFVQLGVLEFHVWGSRVDRLEQPDRMVLDLDPDPSVSWPQLVSAARHVRERLEGSGLESFVKTTGGKGLHVVVPLRRGPEWDEVKDVSHALARAFVAESPDVFVATMTKSKRHGKIFVDYLRNARGATWVAPYSTRARPGAPVSTPLAWDELDSEDIRVRFTLENVPARLARLRRDPWADIAKTHQSLGSLRKRLGAS
jgi:bifunctional non-homologous end joining protein LigD